MIPAARGASGGRKRTVRLDRNVQVDCVRPGMIHQRTTPQIDHAARGCSWPGRVLVLVGGVVLALVLGVAGASADTERVQDVEAGLDAPFLGISSVQFSNGRSAVTMTATHPSLIPDQVDRFELQIYADRRRESVNRRTYVLVSQEVTDEVYRRGLHLYRSEPGMEYPQLLRCPGIAMVAKAADSSVDREGKVTARVPRSCLPGSDFVKFGYAVSNFGGNVHDTAPGPNSPFGTFTRWVRRG